MSFRPSEDESPFIAITVEPPVEDSAKLYYNAAQFLGGEDKGGHSLNLLGQLDDALFGPMPGFGSPFAFADDSASSTPSLWVPRSPTDPLSPCDFEKPLDDILNSPRSPLDLSPTGSSPLSLTFDQVTLEDEHAGHYAFYTPGGHAFRNRPYGESITVAPRDVLNDVDPLSILPFDGPNKDGLHLMAPLFDGEAEDNQTSTLVAFGQPAPAESVDAMAPTNSSALFSGNLTSQPGQDNIPIAPPHSQQPVYLSVQGPTRHRHSLSDPNLVHRTSPLSTNSSPHISDLKPLSVQTGITTAQPTAHQATSPQTSYLSPDTEIGWRRNRMRSDSASSLSAARHSPYSRTSPRRSNDQLPLAEEADLHRHVSDPTGSSKYGISRPVRSSRRKTVQDPVDEETVSAFAQPLPDQRTLGSAPRSPASPSTSPDVSDSNANIHKPVVASQKCKVASEKRRTANKLLFACPMEGCNSTFTAKHNVTNHMNSHLGLRPYQCRHCDGAFATSGTCNRHERNCSGNKRS